MPPQFVQSFIIHGKPVNSSNHKRASVNRRTGRAMMHSSREFRVWFTDATEQIRADIAQGGHDITLVAAVRTLTNGHHEIVEKVTRPVFTEKYFPDGYQITIYFYHPRRVQARTSQGVLKFTKNGTPWMQRYWPDLDGTIKGTWDSLEKAGALDNDRWVWESIVRRKPVLPDGASPFLSVIIQAAGSPVPFPVLPLDLTVHMPRVFDTASDWFDQRAREQAYEEFLARGQQSKPVPISKVRCSRCHMFVGPGHVETEIWLHFGDDRWGESRWPDEAVIICGSCAEHRYEYEDQVEQDEITQETLRFLSHRFASLGSWVGIPERSTMQYGYYTKTRNVIEQQHKPAYRTQYCLVSADQIGTIDWFSDDPDSPGIEQLRSAAQRHLAEIQQRTVRAADIPLLAHNLLLQNEDMHDYHASTRRRHTRLDIRADTGFRLAHTHERDSGEGGAECPHPPDDVSDHAGRHGEDRANLRCWPDSGSSDQSTRGLLPGSDRTYRTLRGERIVCDS